MFNHLHSERNTFSCVHMEFPKFSFVDLLSSQLASCTCSCLGLFVRRCRTSCIPLLNFMRFLSVWFSSLLMGKSYHQISPYLLKILESCNMYCNSQLKLLSPPVPKILSLKAGNKEKKTNQIRTFCIFKMCECMFPLKIHVITTNFVSLRK